MNANPSFCLVSGLDTYGKWTEAGNEIRAWAYAMGGDVYNGARIVNYSDFDKYDITMVELTAPMLDVALGLSRNSTTKVVGLVEGDLMPRFWSSTQYERYINVLNAIDMVGIINDKAHEVMRNLTTTPVCMIGIPYPLQWAYENRDPIKTNKTVELGSTPNGRGGIWTLATFNKLNTEGIAFPWNLDDEVATRKMANSKLSFISMTDWRNYFRIHSKFYLGLHLDDRATWGRFPLDCAAANMPCVSTVGSYTQKVLFPDLTIEHYEVNKAIELCNRLLSDGEFYKHVIEYASEQIKQFDLAPTKERFLKFL